MYKYIDYCGFMKYLFDDQKQAEKQARLWKRSWQHNHQDYQI